MRHDDYLPYLFVGGPRHGRFYATNGAPSVFMPTMPDLSVADQQSIDRPPDATIQTSEYRITSIGGVRVYVFWR